jgi:hypothetical protein
LFLNVFILGNEDSQFPLDDDSEASASETTETLNEKISSNRQFGVRVGYPTQTGAVYSTQSGASAVHQTQSGATAGYPKKSRNSTALSTI